MELNMQVLRKICSIANIEITMHAAKRLEQRNISIRDIISGIQKGKIIEQYPTDYPFPSCLILGLTCNGSFLHIVVGSDLKRIWIITAYYPSLEQWKAGFEKRKEQTI